MYLSKHNISKLTLRLPTRATPQEATHTLVREDKGGVGPRIADPAGGHVTAQDMYILSRQHPVTKVAGQKDATQTPYKCTVQIGIYPSTPQDYIMMSVHDCDR